MTSPTAAEFRAAAEVLRYLTATAQLPEDDVGHAGHFAWLLDMYAVALETRRDRQV